MVMMLTACGSDAPKKVVIGLDDNFAPMGFRNEKNEIVGFDIDLAREACKRCRRYRQHNRHPDQALITYLH